MSKSTFLVRTQRYHLHSVLLHQSSKYFDMRIGFIGFIWWHVEDTRSDADGTRYCYRLALNRTDAYAMGTLVTPFGPA